jgi:signal transduction histidine kinase
MVNQVDILNARILVVDDQDANVRLLEGMLRIAGYASIESTTDPNEVCELHRKNRYALILLDLQMPGMDGFQVMEGLKEIEEDNYLPVVVITAQPNHKLRALQAGAKDFVTKPFDLAELRARVHNILEVRLLHMEAKNYSKLLEENAELESLASLGGLVAAIAHEINSPLGAILSSANVAMLAAEKLTSGPDAKAVDALLTNARVICEATRRISSLVGRLRVFAGIDQSRYTRVDLVQSIEDTVALLKPEFEDRIAVIIESEPVPVIFGYATELHQLFLNLLRNAVQAIDGAGSLTIRATADETWIHVDFVDSGRGIPPSQLRTLFTPGFSSGSGRVRASLSLFTCMAIVKKHRGDIRVQSELGRGSTFTVLLPRSLEKMHNDLEPSAVRRHGAPS